MDGTKPVQVPYGSFKFISDMQACTLWKEFCCVPLLSKEGLLAPSKKAPNLFYFSQGTQGGEHDSFPPLYLEQLCEVGEAERRRLNLYSCMGIWCSS